MKGWKVWMAGLAAFSLMLAGCSSLEDREAPSQPAGESSRLEESSSAPSQPEPSQSSEPEEETPDAGFVWPMDAPENHGMDGELLASLHEALQGTQIYAAVTVKDGCIVDEFYQEGYDENSIFRLNSCSKSFTSALVGIALEEGLLDSIDTPIVEYFPQLAGTDKAGIIIRHLLMHKSGLEWHEWTREGESFFELNRSENWVDYVLGKPLLAEPGTVFTYTTGGTHLLAAILEQVTDQPLMDYARERLFTPLGMESVRWRADPQGILDGGNGIEMTARDAARFGQLYLQGGNWQGLQLVPADWVEVSTSALERRHGEGGSYGYQWWTRSFGARGDNVFLAMGAMGQFIFVVPEQELVVVMTANTSQFAPYPYFTDYILAACS